MSDVAMEETYMDVRSLIGGVCHDFRRAYGGDVEEYFAHASATYVDAYNDHNPDYPFPVWVRMKVWSSLLDQYRVHARRLKALPRVGMEACAGLAVYDRPAFRLDEFASDLSDDARTAIRLILEPPAELTATAEERGGYGLNWRSALRDYLHASGWSTRRVSAAFHEIKAALS